MESDINRQHGLASSFSKKLERILKSKSVILATKLRVFNGYVEVYFCIMQSYGP